MPLNAKRRVSKRPVAELYMSDTEFDIIRRYFTRQDSNRGDVVTGIGDDAALLRVPAGMELVVCMDTLVDGVHFPGGTPATAIGHKALAVNLSDLAAMGAEPAWVTLSLTMPESDPDWLAAFSRGFFELADRYQVQLVGGDTTQGPLAVTVQAHGFVPAGQALRRQGAQAGDHIYVTGTLGDAGLALQRAAQEIPGSYGTQHAKGIPGTQHGQKRGPIRNGRVEGATACGIDYRYASTSSVRHLCPLEPIHTIH